MCIRDREKGVKGMLKAIIVDDDLNVAACLRALIPWSELGYQVAAEAANAAEGLAKLLDIRPAVVITDPTTPVMDGACLLYTSAGSSR